jgi:hypothetical protein
MLFLMAMLSLLAASRVLAGYAAELQPVYQGQECYPSSTLHEAIMEPDDFSFVRNETGCVMWKSGRFLEALSNNATFMYANNTPCAAFQNGSWTHGRWKDPCDTMWLNSSTLRQSLVGKRIVFTGDSLNRQLFLRLVWHVRGFREIIEHYFHSSATYAFNGTHDVLAIAADQLTDEIISPIKNPQFVAHFLWAKELEWHNILDQKFDAVVVGAHYWLKDTTSPRHLALQNVVFVTTPALPAAGSASKRQLHDQRNTWIRQTGRAFLPMEEMTRDRAFLRNSEDNMHFQCGFEVRFPGQVTWKYKAPATGDCRDFVSLNEVMIIVRIIYGNRLS